MKKRIILNTISAVFAVLIFTCLTEMWVGGSIASSAESDYAYFYFSNLFNTDAQFSDLHKNAETLCVLFKVMAGISLAISAYIFIAVLFEAGDRFQFAKSKQILGAVLIITCIATIVITNFYVGVSNSLLAESARDSYALRLFTGPYLFAFYGIVSGFCAVLTSKTINVVKR